MISTKKEFHYKVRYLLLGFTSEVDQFELDGGIVIRKGSPEELTEIRERIRYNNAENQCFLLEYEYITEEFRHNAKEGYVLMDELNTFFQIFFDGIVKVGHFIRFVKYEGVYGSIGFCSNPKVSNYFPKEYEITIDNIASIKDNWSNYKALNLTENKALRIALNRFLFSTQKYDSEDCLIDLMIAFEAVYLAGSEKTKISHTLASRSSFLLRNRYKRDEVFTFMKKAYGLRSEIVHGANTEGNEIMFNGKKLNLGSITSTLNDLLKETFKRIIMDMKGKKTHEIIRLIDREMKADSLK